MLRRTAALSLATILGVAGAVVAATPASAGPASPWDIFRADYIAAGTTSIALTEDVTGDAGITLPANKSLTLDLKGHDLTVSAQAEAAALGVPAGTSLSIRDSVGGGVLTATGGQNGAGIGGSRLSASGTVTIQSGTVVATGGTYGAGIGGGIQGAGGTTTITGGNVTATAGNFAAGIGGSNSRSGGAVTITGGTVTAKGGAYGAGLGGGSTSFGGSVSITGGTVTTTGGSYGPGIGAAWHGTFGTVQITGGTVTANGGDRSAGIGGGWETDGVATLIAAPANVTVSSMGGGSAFGAGQSRTGFGSLSLSGTLTIASGSPMTVPEGSSLTMSGAGRIVNNGTIDLSGTIPGAVDNHGTIIVRSSGVIEPAYVTDHDYVVTFVRDNGEPDVTLRVYAENVGNSLQSAPEIAARPGYTLLGWRMNGEPWTASTTLTADSTVTAAWQQILSPFTTRALGSLDAVPAVGTPVGVTVTRQAAPAPTSYTYQWFAGESPLTGATGATYTPTAADLGRTLSVRITPVLADYDGATGSATATATASVTTGTFADAASATIPGTPVVGVPVTGVVSPSTPAATSYTYQWRSNGAPIDGATDLTYTPTADTFGTTLSLAVTPVLAGYNGTTGAGVGTATTSVAAGDFTRVPSVTVSGTPVVGASVSAEITVGALPAPTSYTYQWSAGGTAIDGATGASYTPTAAEYDERLTVTATPVLAGYAGATGAGTSAPTAAALPGDFIAAVVPTITGTPAVGVPLTAEIDTPAAPAPTSYTYQWAAGGDPIEGATGATYTPTVDRFGAQLTVIATPVLTGYVGATGAGTSEPTAAVAEGAFTSAVEVAITGTVTVSQTLTAEITAGSAPATEVIAFQWFADGVAIEGATTGELLLTPALVGTAITVTATPTLTGYVSASGAGTSAATAAVAPAPFTGKLSVAVDGLAQVANTLTAVVTDELTPADAALSYQWFRDGLLLPAETGDTLALTAPLAGSRVSVTVTATATGFVPATASSEPVLVAGPPAITLSVQSATAGDSVIVSGSGFFGEGDLTVELHSDPVVLGTLTPKADGTFLGSFTIPASTPAGDHEIVVLDAAGTVIATGAITVTAPAAPGTAQTTAALAATGSAFDATLLVLVALGLLATGVVARRTASRRTL